MTAVEPLQWVNDFLEILDEVIFEGQCLLWNLAVSVLYVTWEDEKTFGSIGQEEGMELMGVWWIKTNWTVADWESTQKRGLLEIKYVFNLTTLHCTDSLQQFLYCYLGNKVWLLYLPSLFLFQPTVLHLWFWTFELLSLKKSIFHQVEVVINISNKWKYVWWIFSQSLH